MYLPLSVIISHKDTNEIKILRTKDIVFTITIHWSLYSHEDYSKGFHIPDELDPDIIHKHCKKIFTKKLLTFIKVKQIKFNIKLFF